MKILIPDMSFVKSGGFKVLSNLANYWTNNGHEVTILVPMDESFPYYPLICNIVRIDRKGNVSQEVESYGAIARLLSLFRYINRESYNFDIVLANYNKTVYPVFFASKTNNFYYIQAYEPECYDEIKNNFLKKNISKFLAWFSYFLPLKKVINSNMYVNYKNIKTDKVVFPGIDLEVYYPREREYKKNTEKFVVGCIGREEAWKGSDDVAEAVKILHSKGYKNVEFVVAFNPVRYLNHHLVMPDGDMNLSDFYRSLDVLVTPGHIQLEAIHYPVIEAMATKTPLITTGYYPACDENSFLVPIKSPLDIAIMIIYIMENYDQAIAKANTAYISVDQFAWNKLSLKFLAIFDENIKV